MLWKVVNQMKTVGSVDAALARWENEGGVTDSGQPGPGDLMASASQLPALTPAEWDQLRLRVIAIENLLITMLARSSDRDRELARAMAHYIAPRPGFTRHHLTLGAASQIIRLVDRAVHFQGALTEDHD
jgi:hypothetical protein